MSALSGLSLALGGLDTAANMSMQQETNAQNQQMNLFSNMLNYAMYQQSREDSNTAVQRRVADANAAGINPLFALGATAAGTTSASSASPGNPAVAPRINMTSALTNALQARATEAQIENVHADTQLKESAAKKNEADTGKSTAETEGQLISNEFQRDTFDARKRSEDAAADLKHWQAKQIQSNIDKQQYEIDLLIKQSKSEIEKRRLYVSQRLLNNANADNIAALQPYVKLELQARTKAERQAVYLSMAKCAYEERLLDSGVIEQMVLAKNLEMSETEARTRSLEIETALKQWNYDLKNGSFHEGNVLFDIESMIWSELSAASNSLLGGLKL